MILIDIKKFVLASLYILLASSIFAGERGIKRNHIIVEPEKGLALVIGNSNYSSTSPLKNPKNDADSMGEALTKLGFNVIVLIDANSRQMNEGIRQFGDQLRDKNTVGIFYYAGHGIQVNGENYLLPVDINPSTETDVQYDAVPLGKVLGQMKAARNEMNLVILDACRNNPFKSSMRSATQGLAQVTAPAGTFISYATSPGSVAADGDGEHGLFTEKILRHMNTPGLKIEEVFKRVRIDVKEASNNKQIPWDSSSITGDFFFSSNQFSNINSNSFSDKYKLEKEMIEETKNKWENWQIKMSEDFDSISNFEKKIVPSELKVESWESFLNTWVAENPFSEKDEKLRGIAAEKKLYWSHIVNNESRTNQRKGRLFVDTYPNNSKIRILNIKPKFHQGIELDKGRYYLEISSNGYEKQKISTFINLGQDHYISVKLISDSYTNNEEKTANPSVDSEFNKNKGRLYVKTNPVDSNIRILNIKPKFHQGIELDKGKYYLEIKSEGYIKNETTVSIESGKDEYLKIELIKDYSFFDYIRPVQLMSDLFYISPDHYWLITIPIKWLILLIHTGWTIFMLCLPIYNVFSGEIDSVGELVIGLIIFYLIYLIPLFLLSYISYNYILY